MKVAWAEELGPVAVQGASGSAARRHIPLLLEAGTQVVVGVAPGHGGETIAGLPIFDTLEEAGRYHPCAATISFVPGDMAWGSAVEAHESGIAMTVLVAEAVPLWDAIRIRQLANGSAFTVVGPNTAGVIRPGVWKLGIMPASLYAPGPCAVVGRTGSAMHEVANLLARNGSGLSLGIDIGGDAVTGMDLVEAYRVAEQDSRTECILVLGEIGTDKEEQLARYLHRHPPDKPVAAFIMGRHAPGGRQMGHAGAIISGSRGSAMEKYEVLQKVGVHACYQLQDIVRWLQKHQGGGE